MDRKTLARYIDHTALKPDVTAAGIRELCQEADRYAFKNVCVNPCYISLAKRSLQELGGKGKVGICTVLGFPLGAITWEMKGFEAEVAVEQGADEIDIVMNIGAFKSHDYDAVRDDIAEVVNASSGKTVKVIIEAGLLTDEEKVNAAQLVIEGGAQFVKTSTGFGYGGATVEDVRLLKNVVGDQIGLKASGGINTAQQAMALIEAGATRIGSSSSVAIIESLKA